MLALITGGDDDPYTLSWRGLDNPGYYMCDPEQYVQLLNYSGCGNTTNANSEPMQRLIIDSLRWWVTEYHVDGFRFDLASALCRDGRGNVMVKPPLIEAIAKDPLLSQVRACHAGAGTGLGLCVACACVSGLGSKLAG